MTSFNPVLAVSSAVRSTVAGHVNTWSVESQLGARRNAMVACTALAARRAEREDVDDFLAALKPQEQGLRGAVAARR
jgi:DNA-binding FadR family transcriptional regulator